MSKTIKATPKEMERFDRRLDNLIKRTRFDAMRKKFEGIHLVLVDLGLFSMSEERYWDWEYNGSFRFRCWWKQGEKIRIGQPRSLDGRAYDWRYLMDEVSMKRVKHVAYIKTGQEIKKAGLVYEGQLSLL